MKAKGTSPSTREIVAQNLKVLRDVRGMSQDDLARAVGISRRTVARLEAGDIEDPGVEQMQRVARALRVTLGLLVEVPLRAAVVPMPAPLAEALAADASGRLLERMLRGAE